MLFPVVPVLCQLLMFFVSLFSSRNCPLSFSALSSFNSWNSDQNLDDCPSFFDALCSFTFQFPSLLILLHGCTVAWWAKQKTKHWKYVYTLWCDMFSMHKVANKLNNSSLTSKHAMWFVCLSNFEDEKAKVLQHTSPYSLHCKMTLTFQYSVWHTFALGLRESNKLCVSWTVYVCFPEILTKVAGVSFCTKGHRTHNTPTAVL